MEINVFFPSGKRVEAKIKEDTIALGEGPGDEGIEPLDLFFASIALCVGKYVVEFCTSRGLPYPNASVRLTTQWNEEKSMHTKVRIQIVLPEDFPEKYKRAVLRLVDICSVKKHIFNPPEFQTEVVTKQS